MKYIVTQEMRDALRMLILYILSWILYALVMRLP